MRPDWCSTGSIADSSASTVIGAFTPGINEESTQSVSISVSCREVMEQTEGQPRVTGTEVGVSGLRDAFGTCAGCVRPPH